MCSVVRWGCWASPLGGGGPPPPPPPPSVVVRLRPPPFGGGLPSLHGFLLFRGQQPHPEKAGPTPTPRKKGTKKTGVFGWVLGRVLFWLLGVVLGGPSLLSLGWWWPSSTSSSSFSGGSPPPSSLRRWFAITSLWRQFTLHSLRFSRSPLLLLRQGVHLPSQSGVNPPSSL